MIDLALPGIEIYILLLECGMCGLLVDLIRRVAKMETRMSLCKACPITKEEVKTNV